MKSKKLKNFKKSPKLRLHTLPPQRSLRSSEPSHRVLFPSVIVVPLLLKNHWFLPSYKNLRFSTPSNKFLCKISFSGNLGKNLVFVYVSQAFGLSMLCVYFKF